MSGLTRRLLAAHALVIAVGAATLAVVAVLAGPSLFRSHIRAAVGPVSDSAAAHLDEAYARALLLSLGFAVLAAAVTALGFSWYKARRIARPVDSLAVGAGPIALATTTRGYRSRHPTMSSHTSPAASTEWQPRCPVTRRCRPDAAPTRPQVSQISRMVDC